jgi:hypothetical protein
VSVAIAPHYDVQFVSEVCPADDGVRVVFGDGTTAWLDASHPNFTRLQELAVWATSGRTVGFVMDGHGRLLDLNAAHETTVYWLAEFPTDPTYFRVAFWGHSPLCGLTRDHPEFDRIRATLTRAAGKPDRVWLTTSTEETVDDEPDEDGLTAALPKILDVRAC